MSLVFIYLALINITGVSMYLTIPQYTVGGVYRPKVNPMDKTYGLEYVSPRYPVPSKFYGELKNYLDYYTEAFKRHKYNAGLLLTGAAGTGKTDLARELSNRCITQGFKIVELNNVKYTDDLITFLDSLDKVVLFFDEFGKTYNNAQQEKMLTMLSTTIGKERIVIITENNSGRISQFIRNRPSRSRYSKDFGKLSKETIKGLAADMTIQPEFLQDLLRSHDRLTTFTFDHLQAIFSEHEIFPELDFKTIVSYLNLEFMSGVEILKLSSLLYKDKDIPIENVYIRPNRVPLKMVETGSTIVLMITMPVEQKDDDTNANQQPPSPMNGFGRPREETVRINGDDLKLMDDTSVVYEKKDLMAVFNITYGKPSSNDDFY